MLAGYPQLLAAPSGGHRANVSEGALITRDVALEWIVGESEEIRTCYQSYLQRLYRFVGCLVDKGQESAGGNRRQASS